MMKIDLTKGRLQISHTCYPDGKVEYHLPCIDGFQLKAGARHVLYRNPDCPQENGIYEAKELGIWKNTE